MSCFLVLHSDCVIGLPYPLLNFYFVCKLFLQMFVKNCFTVFFKAHLDLSLKYDNDVIFV